MQGWQMHLGIRLTAFGANDDSMKGRLHPPVLNECGARI